MYGVGDTKRAVAKPREGLFIEVVVIGFVGAILFLVVDKFERSPMANLLKFLILVGWRGDPAQIAAITRHCIILAGACAKERGGRRGQVQSVGNDGSCFVGAGTQTADQNSSPRVER
jgi:hypothetical protein